MSGKPPLDQQLCGINATSAQSTDPSDTDIAGLSGSDQRARGHVRQSYYARESSHCRSNPPAARAVRQDDPHAPRYGSRPLRCSREASRQGPHWRRVGPRCPLKLHERIICVRRQWHEQTHPPDKNLCLLRHDHCSFELSLRGLPLMRYKRP